MMIMRADAKDSKKTTSATDLQFCWLVRSTRWTPQNMTLRVTGKEVSSLEHAVDLETEFVLSATMHAADQTDSDSLVDSVLQVQINWLHSGSEQEVEEALPD